MVNYLNPCTERCVGVVGVFGVVGSLLCLGGPSEDELKPLLMMAALGAGDDP